MPCPEEGGSKLWASSKHGCFECRLRELEVLRGELRQEWREQRNAFADTKSDLILSQPDA
jgi:hypothetical protein